MYLAEQLVKEALRSEVVLYLKDGQLAFVAEQGNFSGELKAKVSGHKSIIIEYLRQQQLENQACNQSAIAVKVGAIKPVDRDRLLPLSYAQQQIWFAELINIGGAKYNMPVAIKLTGKLDVDAVCQSLSAIVARHEVLRSTYYKVDGDSWQQIHAPKPATVERFDLSDLYGTEQDKQVEALRIAEASKPFDLSNDLMLRSAVIKLSDNENVLLFTIHHIASDGWSMGLLVNEFAANYMAFTNRLQSSLPDLKIQYADYACWQREYIAEAQLNNQIEYWMKQLSGVSPAPVLPTQKRRPAQQRYFQQTCISSE